MAQMQLMQAQTEKTKAEAENIAGGEKDKLAAEVESLSQGVKNMKAKEELDKAQTSLVNLNRDILSATKADAIKMVQEKTREAFHRANIAANQEYVNTQTTKTRIDTITAELNSALVRNEATRIGIELTKAQIKQITNDINVSWEKLRQGDESNAIQAIFQVLSKDSNTANMKMDWAQE